MRTRRQRGRLSLRSKGAGQKSKKKTVRKNEKWQGLESLEARTLLSSVPVADPSAVAYEVTQDWQSGYQGAIVIQNTVGQEMNDWQLRFESDSPISSLWNAEIVEQNGNEYVIEGPSWGDDLGVGQEVNIGFIGGAGDRGISNVMLTYDDGVMPPNPDPDQDQDQDSGETDNSVSAEFRVDSDWGSGFNGSIVVTNNGDAEIDGWTLEFDWPRQIDTMWNAQIENIQGDHYTLTNSSWNGVIQPGQSLTIGFGGSPGNVTDEPMDFKLNGILLGDDSTDPEVTLPTVSISDATITEGDSGETMAYFTVSLDEASDEPVQVGFITRDGTATGLDNDYQFNSGVMIFEPGQTEQTFSVIVNGDTTVEQDETFTVEMHALADSAILGDGIGVGTIENDDIAPPSELPVVSISDATVTEGDSGQSTAYFTVSLDQPSDQVVRVGMMSQSGTATEADGDFIHNSGVIEFQPGETEKMVPIIVLGDTQVEQDETFTVELVVLQNSAVLGDGTGEGSILNDDVTEPPVEVQPNMSVADTLVIEGTGTNAEAVFTVTLDRVSDEVITVNYQTEDGSAMAGEDYTAASGTLTFAAGQTTQQIRIAINGDDMIESNEYFLLSLTSVNGAMITDGQAMGTIENDDRLVDPDPDPVTDYKVVAYFAEWGIYARQFDMANVPADRLTHLNYAFTGIDQATWDHRIHDPEAFQKNMAEMKLLKEANPHLKVLIAVGGWTLSGGFSTMAADANARATFIENTVDFVEQYGFDGVDIDWEYPVSGGPWSTETRPDDTENFVTFLAEMDAAFDQYELETGKDLELTAATPIGFDKIANHDIGGMAEHLDFFNVMAYDFHGGWDQSRTGHNAPLYANPEDPYADRDKWNTDWAINEYLRQGADPEQLVLGAPLYGRAWSGVEAGDDAGLYNSATGLGQGTYGQVDAGSRGVYSIWDVKNKLETQPDQYTRHWDDTAKAAYVYAPNVEGGLWISYEDTDSMQVKIDYVKDMGLGGMMFWEIDDDIRDFDSDDHLVSFVADQLLGGPIAGSQGALITDLRTPFETNNNNNNGNSIPSPQTLSLSEVDVTLSQRSAYPGGFGGNLTLTNTSNATYDNWRLTTEIDANLGGMWGMQLVSQSGNFYTFAPESWNTSLEPGETVSLGFDGTGLLGLGQISALDSADFNYAVNG